MNGVTQAEFARQIGKSKQYVGKLVRQGKITVGDDGTIDPATARVEMMAARHPGRSMSQDNTDAVDDDVDNESGDLLRDSGGGERGKAYADAARDHKAVQAKLAQLDYETKIGLLVRKDEVTRQAFEAARTLRERMMAVPQDIAGVLVSMTDEREIVTFLRKKIRDVLTEAALDVESGS